MVRVLAILSLFGLLFLTACGGEVGIFVYTADNEKIGVIEVVDSNTALLKSVHGDERGKVRGSLVRDEAGARRGTIVEREGKWLILNADDDEIGTLENGKDCYGKGKDVVGRISADTDREAAGAACLLFFLEK